uniref:Putative restriction endonuclease domain-containing protein n=1 Tax=uncultured Thiotrichaceae bacterium TaxID=298394 RepID=A0A6S6UAS5_9GAMM|nr:MAG: Unknown protein [uncultured Thiotrichaceae bacterium]
MSNALKYDLIPFDEYLSGERDIDTRNEYVNGQIYAMAGASRAHNTIATTFAALIETNLEEACQVWQSDMKVAIRNEMQDFAYYPDIMAACDNKPGDEYTCTKPILIIEVLSRSTERNDLKEKFDNYTSIPSLIEYAVVSQDVPLVRLFRRKTSWTMEMYRADETFTLESVDIEVPVQHIYRRVRKEVGLDVSW